MKLYLDVCSINRPFDDQTQDIVKLEAEAVLLILERSVSKYILFGSQIINFEVSKIPDLEKKEKVNQLIKIISNDNYLEVTENVSELAKKLMEIGINLMDSYHIAICEVNEIDYFITTDQKLISFDYKKLVSTINIFNPVKFMMEVE